MGQAVLPGNPPVEITLRRSARARRVSLRVSALDGRVTLSLPRSMNTAEALAFAEEKSDWIRGHLACRQAEVRAGIGASIAFEGREVPIRSADIRAPRIEAGVLLVPGAADTAPARVGAFLKQAARARLHAASARHAARVDRPLARITLRDTRSRWGSCSSTGNLMYSWRLIMAPAEVLNYVAAHEVAHLVEMNHSAAFWRVVGTLCPDYAAPRRWLRQNGAALHRYRFED